MFVLARGYEMNASPVKVELLSTIINPLYNLVVSAEYRSKKSWARENTCQWEIPSYFDDQNAQLCGVTEVTWCGSCGVPVCKRHAADHAENCGAL